VTLPYGTAQPPTTRSLSGPRFLAIDPLGAPGVDVRKLGSRHGLTEYAFVYPLGGSVIWYRIWIDRSYRLRRELMQVLKDQEQPNAAFPTYLRGAGEAPPAARGPVHDDFAKPGLRLSLP